MRLAGPEHDQISISTDEAETEYYNTCECTCLDWHTCGDVKNTEFEEPAEHEVEGEAAPTSKTLNSTSWRSLPSMRWRKRPS